MKGWGPVLLAAGRRSEGSGVVVRWELGPAVQEVMGPAKSFSDLQQEQQAFGAYDFTIDDLMMRN